MDRLAVQPLAIFDSSTARSVSGASGLFLSLGGKRLIGFVDDAEMPGEGSPRSDYRSKPDHSKYHSHSPVKHHNRNNECRLHQLGACLERSRNFLTADRHSRKPTELIFDAAKPNIQALDNRDQAMLACKHRNKTQNTLHSLRVRPSRHGRNQELYVRPEPVEKYIQRSLSRDGEQKSPFRSVPPSEPNAPIS